MGENAEYKAESGEGRDCSPDEDLDSIMAKYKYLFKNADLKKILFIKWNFNNTYKLPILQNISLEVLIFTPTNFS